MRYESQAGNTEMLGEVDLAHITADKPVSVYSQWFWLSSSISYHLMYGFDAWRSRADVILLHLYYGCTMPGQFSLQSNQCCCEVVIADTECILIIIDHQELCTDYWIKDPSQPCFWVGNGPSFG